MQHKSRTLGALAAALLGVVAGTLPIFLTASMAAEIGQSFHFDALSLGVAVAVFHVVGLLISPRVSAIVRFTGIRWSLQVAAALAGTASVAIALWAHTATELICILAVAGISNGLAGPTASGLLHSAVPRSQHGLAFGVQQAGAPTSVLLAGLAVPALAIPLGWRPAFLSGAALAVLAALVAGSLPRTSTAASGQTAAAEPVRARDATLTLAAAAAVASGAGVAMVSFLVLFATHAGIGRGVSGLLLMGVSIAAIFGRIATGTFVDRYGRDPLVATFAMFVGCSIALALLVQATPATIVAGALTMGGVGWAWHGTLTLAVTSRNQEAPVWAVGVLMSGVFAGAAAGPLLVGAVATRASLSTAWSICLVLSIVPLVLVVLVVRRGSDSDDVSLAAPSTARRSRGAPDSNAAGRNVSRPTPGRALRGSHGPREQTPR